MANPLLPAGRSTPINAYIALRQHGVFANVLRVRGVTAASSKLAPGNGQGIGSALLGGSASLKANGGF